MLIPDIECSKIIYQCLPALHQEGLITDNYAFGPSETLKRVCADDNLLKKIEYGIFVEPTIIGIELFLAALGRKDILSSKIFETSDLCPPLTT